MARTSKGLKCGHTASLAYLTFEDAVLNHSLHLALDDQTFGNRGEVARLTTAIAERGNAARAAQAKAERLYSAWADDGSLVARAVAKKAEAEAQAIHQQIEALTSQRQQASGRATSQEHFSRVADIRANLYHEDLDIRVPARKKVATALRALIQRIEWNGQQASIYGAKGHMLMTVDRKGRMDAFDLLKEDRWHEPELDAYRRRRKALLVEGNLFRYSGRLSPS